MYLDRCVWAEVAYVYVQGYGYTIVSEGQLKQVRQDRRILIQDEIELEGFLDGDERGSFFVSVINRKVFGA